MTHTGQRVIFLSAAALMFVLVACSGGDAEQAPSEATNADPTMLKMLDALATVQANSQAAPWPTSAPRPTVTSRLTPTPIPVVQTHFTEGAQFYRDGEFGKAIEEFNSIIELEPENTSAYGNRGLTYTRLGEIALAIEDFSRIIEIDPKDAKAFYNRGTRFGQLSEYDQALEDYNQAIELIPAYAVAYFARGLIYKELGKNQEAERDIQKAQELGFNPPPSPGP